MAYVREKPAIGVWELIPIAYFIYVAVQYATGNFHFGEYTKYQLIASLMTFGTAFLAFYSTVDKTEVWVCRFLWAGMGTLIGLQFYAEHVGTPYIVERAITTILSCGYAVQNPLVDYLAAYIFVVLLIIDAYIWKAVVIDNRGVPLYHTRKVIYVRVGRW